MKGRGYLAVLIGFALYLCASASNANIIGLNYASDGDGALVCSNINWSGNSPAVDLSMSGILYSSPAHLIADVTASDALDPTLKINNSIENSTTFAWTEFLVNLTMGVPFAVTNVTVGIPADWMVASFDQSATYTGSNYLATVVYKAGTPIPNDGVSSIDFGYWVVFSGSPSYQLCQEFVVVPEPSAIVLAATGLVLLGLASKRRRQQS
jgi:hypothetical protein